MPGLIPAGQPVSFTEIVGLLGESLEAPYSLANLASNYYEFPSPYAMSNFREPSLTSFWYAENGGIGTACYLSCETEAWHNGAGALPTVGDIVYTDSSGTAPIGPSFNGPRGMNETQNQPSYFVFAINQKMGNGIVSVVGSCEE